MKLENIKLNLDTELVLNVGDPIGKTNAPRCYNKLFERLHMNAIMLPCEIKKGELPKLLDACRLMGIHYLCPTMPHKSDFVDLLDDVDETSKLFHSVNAIRLDENGSHGSGMDGKGAVKAMEEGGAKLNGINALLYGAGGISGVTAYELAQSGVKKLYIANRTPEKAERIAKLVNENTAAAAEVIGTDALNPYAGKALPHYQSGKVQTVPDAEWETLLGRPIPDDRVKIDRNMTLGELNHGRSPLGWLVWAVLTALLNASYKKGKPDLNVLFQYNMPLRALAKMTNGAISMGMVDGIVMEVQGFWVIGLVRVIFETVKNVILNAQLENRLRNS